MKNKLITSQQIDAILQAVYTTNMPASNFDALKKFFVELPNVEKLPEPTTPPSPTTTKEK